MSLLDLAPELLTQIFSSLHTISDVLRLSQTCKWFHHLLRSSRLLPTLFAAAEREFGPIDDIVRLVTWNGNQSVWGSTDAQPVTVTRNFELLKQIIKVGHTATKVEEIFPAHKWGEDRYLDRRSLTSDEKWRVRRAVYRYWLFCDAFQNELCTRGLRRLPGLVEDRSRLLRGWNSEELFEIEDVRLVLEDIISVELCPTDGMVQQWFNRYCDFSDMKWQQRLMPYVQFQLCSSEQNRNWNSWPPDRFSSHSHRHVLPASLFHSHRDDQQMRDKLNTSIPQRRRREMRGWGDDVSQYYVVQSMLKLNPAQIMYLHENVTRREEIEWYIEHEIGGDWFWDNGQTWSDTNNLVLLRRGWDIEKVGVAIEDGTAGLVGRLLGKDGLDSSIELALTVEESEGESNSICLQYG